VIREATLPESDTSGSVSGKGNAWLRGSRGSQGTSFPTGSYAVYARGVQSRKKSSSAGYNL
jgi:hypothetical protein